MIVEHKIPIELAGQIPATLDILKRYCAQKSTTTSSTTTNKTSNEKSKSTSSNTELSTSSQSSHTSQPSQSSQTLQTVETVQTVRGSMQTESQLINEACASFLKVFLDVAVADGQFPSCDANTDKVNALANYVLLNVLGISLYSSSGQLGNADHLPKNEQDSSSSIKVDAKNSEINGEN